MPSCWGCHVEAVCVCQGALVGPCCCGLQAAAAAISGLEGVVDHGLFLDMVDVCIIAASGGVEVREK